MMLWLSWLVLYSSICLLNTPPPHHTIPPSTILILCCLAFSMPRAPLVLLAAASPPSLHLSLPPSVLQQHLLAALPCRGGIAPLKQNANAHQHTQRHTKCVDNWASTLVDTACCSDEYIMTTYFGHLSYKTASYHIKVITPSASIWSILLLFFSHFWFLPPFLSSEIVPHKMSCPCLFLLLLFVLPLCSMHFLFSTSQHKKQCLQINSDSQKHPSVCLTFICRHPYIISPQIWNRIFLLLNLLSSSVCVPFIFCAVSLAQTDTSIS